MAEDLLDTVLELADKDGSLSDLAKNEILTALAGEGSAADGAHRRRQSQAVDTSHPEVAPIRRRERFSPASAFRDSEASGRRPASI
jgi:hypothetical protein